MEKYYKVLPISYYKVLPISKEEHRATQAFLIELGFCWIYSGKKIIDTEDYGIGINLHTLSMTHSPRISNFKEIRLHHIPELLNKRKNEISVILNKEYTAKIQKEEKTVSVGCQEFTFDAIKELYNACFE